MTGGVAPAIEAAVGAPVASMSEVGGGFTTARTFRAELADGRTVFVKQAEDDEARTAIANEATALRPSAASMPRLIAVADTGEVLVTEWLDADWSPSMRHRDGLWAAVDAVAEIEPPDTLFLVHQGSGREWWSDVVDADDDRIDLGWIRRHIDALRSASLDTDTSGDRLLHGDLGPGNWCRDEAGRWRFVDWGAAHRGNPLVDHTIASIRAGRLTGSPTASPRLRAAPEFAAFVTGRLVAETHDIDWSAVAPKALADRLADIDAGFRLCAEVLGLEPPPLTGRR